MSLRFCWAFVFVLPLIVACQKSGHSSPSVPDIIAVKDSGGPDSPSCQKFIQSLPADAVHGFVSTTENPEDPASRPLQIFYYGRLREGTPIVFFNGGPTGNSHGSFSVLSRTQLENPSWQNLTFVYIDQRGTGCSTPYPEAKAIQDLDQYKYYDSTGIVRDAELVRQKLFGDKPWKVFGQSYGGLIVHRYVMMFPQSVVAAYSHGFALTSDPQKTFQQRFAYQTRTLQAYFGVFPGDAQILQRLTDKLGLQTCFTSTANKSAKVCGLSVLSPFNSLIGFRDQWDWIHRSLLSLRGGITQTWIDKVFFNPSRLGSSASSWADQIIWQDDMTESLRDPEACGSAYRSVNDTGLYLSPAPLAQDWLINECNSALQVYNTGRWRASRWYQYVTNSPHNWITISDFQAQLQKYPQIKFYLYAGQIDPYSPPEIFSDEAQALKDRIQFTLFPSSAHDGFFSEPQVWYDLMDTKTQTLGAL